MLFHSPPSKLGIVQVLSKSTKYNMYPKAEKTGGREDKVCWVTTHTAESSKANSCSGPRMERANTQKIKRTGVGSLTRDIYNSYQFTNI